MAGSQPRQGTIAQYARHQLPDVNQAKTRAGLWLAGFSGDGLDKRRGLVLKSATFDKFR